MKRMKKNSLKNIFNRHCPENSDYVEIANIDNSAIPTLDYFWITPKVKIYFLQKKMTEKEIKKILSKNTISLFEGTHLILGREINKNSKMLITNEAQKIYNKVYKDVKNKNLKVAKDDPNINLISPEIEISFKDHDENYLIKIRGSGHGLEYYFETNKFLEWALLNGLILNEKLIKIIGIKQAEKRSLKKDANSLIANLSIVAAAQVLWFITPSLTIESMKQQLTIKKYIPGGKKFGNKDTFRNKIKNIESASRRKKRSSKKKSRKKASRSTKSYSRYTFKR